MKDGLLRSTSIKYCIWHMNLIIFNNYKMNRQVHANIASNIIAVDKQLKNTFPRTERRETAKIISERLIKYTNITYKGELTKLSL